MDFYLTEIKSNNQQGVRLHFPMNPEKVSLTSGVTTNDFTIQSLGEVRVPIGNRLDTIQWQGILPGEGRASAAFVSDWQKPDEILSILNNFKRTGAVLRLLVTDTPLNLDVFIEGLSHDHAGGMGDVSYAISLTENKPVRIGTVTEIKASPVPASRPKAPTGKTYTVVSGDTLWKIAHKTLGAGGRYMEIYNLNKAVIGKNPNVISPGMVLQLPGTAKKVTSTVKRTEEVIRTDLTLGGVIVGIYENGKLVNTEWRPNK